MKKFKDYIKDKKDHNIILTGLNVDENFWNNFLLVLNNSSGLSDLLSVSKSKILTWNKKVKDAMKDHENRDQKALRNKKVIRTGLNKS
jgi:hypothetical protein